MNHIRKSIGLVVMLAAVAGCTEEEPTPANPPAANPAMAPKQPVVPQAAKPEPGKETPSKEMQPPPKGEDAKKPGDMKKADDTPPIQGPKTEGKKEEKKDTAANTLSADEIAAIKKLPAADQELAIKQVICPVGGDHLGKMGTPYKTTVQGRTVFLCCDNCEAEIKADPAKYLAKLDGKSGK